MSWATGLKSRAVLPNKKAARKVMYLALKGCFGNGNGLSTESVVEPIHSAAAGLHPEGPLSLVPHSSVTNSLCRMNSKMQPPRLIHLFDESLKGKIGLL